jgi:uroporphyrin-III C-methyltransferase
MLRHTQAGEVVVRLKGGDPSIFGRAGEERAFLEAHGVQVEVIPGVTTASAAAAEFGFSLTTRADARRVLLATGRTLEGPSGDIGIAADSLTTLCLYMGCTDIRRLCSQLLAAGRLASTPAVAAINVSRSNSRLVRSTLSMLPDDLPDAMSDAPVFIAIGDACAAAVSTGEQRAVAPPAAARQAC